MERCVRKRGQSLLAYLKVTKRPHRRCSAQSAADEIEGQGRRTLHAE